MAITVGDWTIRTVPGAAARWRRVAIVVSLLAAVAFVAPRAMAADSPPAVPADTWTVTEGETLWSIATAITGPGEDVRDTVASIKNLNALESSSIRAGEQILIPALD
jgi:hypothetical protein